MKTENIKIKEFKTWINTKNDSKITLIDSIFGFIYSQSLL